MAAALWAANRREAHMRRSTYWPTPKFRENFRVLPSQTADVNTPAVSYTHMMQPAMPE